MYEPVLSHIRTRDELAKLEKEIALLKDSLFKVNEQEGFDVVINSKVRSDIAASISEELKSTNTEKNEYLDGLLAQLSTINSVRLTIAIDPTEHTLDVLKEWVAKNVGNNTILDIRESRSLVAGAIIEYNGRFIDWSLAKILESKTGEHKKLISSVIKRRRD